jgi:adenylate kinase
VGKGTQATLLNERIGACHLSTGDVFRAACARGDCGHSPAIAEAVDYMRRGALVPDSTVWEMVRERSQCLHCPGGFILDGFPRTIRQAESLHRYMEDEGIALSAVIDYEMPLEEIVARLSGRRICENCQAIFHLDGPYGPLRCDHCGGALYQREDDRPEAVTLRMKVYHRSTEPLIEFYKRLGLLISVPAAGSPDDIFARTITALESIHHTG